MNSKSWAELVHRSNMFFYWGQLNSKIAQKHPIFRWGPATPKRAYFGKRFSPLDFSSQKPPRYEIWALFLKIEILLRTILYKNFRILKKFLCDRVCYPKLCLQTKFESMGTFWSREIALNISELENGTKPIKMIISQKFFYHRDQGS